MARPDADRRDGRNVLVTLRLGAQLRHIGFARVIPQLGEVEQRDGAACQAISASVLIGQTPAGR